MPASNSLHRVAVPAVWAVVEGTWICLWARPFFGAGVEPSAEFDLPYPLVALAMVAATLLATWAAPLGLVFWARGVAAAPVVVAGIVGVAVAASGAGSPGEASTSGWVVAIIVVGRGVWIGLDEPSYPHMVRSAGLGAVAFVGLFLAQAADDPTFNAASGSAVWPFVVFLAGTAGILAVVRERELERRLLARPGSPPTLAWLAVLGLPMVAAVGAAVVVAVVAGPVGEPVGEGVGAVASGARTGIMNLAEAVGSLFSGESGENYVPTPDRVPIFDEPPAPREESDSPIAGIVRFLLFVAVVSPLIALVAVGVVKLRKLRFPGGLYRRDPRAGARPSDDETTSVFSARSFLGRFFGFFGRLFRRGRPGSDGVAAGGAPHRWATLPPAPPVRQQYRDMLVTASRTGFGRGLSETPQEFEDRLVERLDPDGAGLELRRLTGLYSDVRYGERPVEAGSEVTVAASEAARAVIAALEPPASPDVPAAR